MNNLSWNDGNNHNKKLGEVFEAMIRHCNSDLKLSDKVVVLRVGEDGYYFGHGIDELAHNWDIVRWRD